MPTLAPLPTVCSLFAVPSGSPSWWATPVAIGLIALGVLGFIWVIVLRDRVRQATAEVRRQYEVKARLEAQLRQSQKLEAVGRLVGGIAHDFNNLLTVINGCADLLEPTLHADPDKAAGLVADIRRAGEKAAALIGQLLTFARQKVIQPQPVDLNAALADAAALLRRVLGEPVAVRVDAAAAHPVARAEAGLVSQILFNLAVNSRDAMPEGGVLTLATTNPEAGWVRLAVSDTGAGMTDEVKARIFEPFFTTKDVGKGTGLGLPTVYGIVQTLGGKIRFRSELGRGTTFEIDLPAASADAQTPATDPLTPTRLPTVPPSGMVRRPEPADAPKISRTGQVILLVEDDDAVRSLARQVLEMDGRTVLEATAPDEALALLAAHSGRIDLMMTDVVMPGMSGRALADRVRIDRPGLKVVFMSGYTADEVLRQGVLEDQVEFLQKPFTPAALRARVAHLLAE